jgi:hypothetical protein
VQIAAILGRMKRVVFLVLGVALAAAVLGACVGDDPATTSPSDQDAAAVGGACSSSEKTCDGKCVAKEARFGCDDPSCVACPGAGAPNTIPSCSAGKCSFECVKGFADCDKNPASGCEVPITSDVANCGACGNLCGGMHATTKTCDNGKCVFGCEAGYAKCGTDADGCSTNTASDKTSCGQCGRNCLEGTCTASACSPVVLTKTEAFPNAMSLDATYVYFANGNNPTDGSGEGIFRVRKNSVCTGASTCSSAMVGGPKVVEPKSLAGDDQNLFWDSSGQMTHSDEGGLGVSSFSTSMMTLAGFSAVANGRIFWTNLEGTNRVMSALLNTTDVQQIAIGPAGSTSAGLAVDATAIYWADNAGKKVFKRSLSMGVCNIDQSAAGPCPILATGLVSPWAIALDATSVYFSELGDAGSINKVPKVGGSPKAIATNQGTPKSLVTDGVWIYWGSFTGATAGTIRRVRTDATCDGVACELVAVAPLPNHLVLDDKALYWVVQQNGVGRTGSVNKIGKWR